MSRIKVVALLLTSAGVLVAGATGLARPSPAPQEKAKPAEPRPADKPADEPNPVLADLDRVVAEAAQEARLGRIEATQLDTELLQMEVGTLKTRVTAAFQRSLSARDRLQSLTAPPDPAMYGFGGGAVPEKPTGEALEAATKIAREHLDYTRKHLEEVRAAYLAKSLELSHAQRRLKALSEDLPAPRQAQIQRSIDASKQAAEARPDSALERRLSDVERKLDRILKALERPGHM